MDKILNIANHIINICIDLEKPINYFTLQKILFLANEKHKEKSIFGTTLFNDSFTIPRYPYPEYEKVYREYVTSCEIKPIILKAEVEGISEKEAKILHETIKENIDLAPWEVYAKIVRILGDYYE